MKKQTISKIAAIGIAAMSVVPMFGVTASADVTLDNGTTHGNGNFKQAYGTANQSQWQITSQTVETYKIQESSASTPEYKQYEFVEQTRAATQNFSIGESTTEVTLYSLETPAPKVKTYGLVYYAYENTIPDTDGKKMIEKAENDCKTDWEKYKAALTAWNTNIKNYKLAVKNANDAKTADENNADQVKSFTGGDGKTYYVTTAQTGKVFSDSDCSVEVSDFVDEKVDKYVNDKVKLSDDSTTVTLTPTTTGLEKHKYVRTLTLKKDVELSTAVANLGGGDYIALDTDGTTIKIGTSSDYNIKQKGTIGSTENPDGTSGNGVTDTDKNKPGTTTPGTTTPSTSIGTANVSKSDKCNSTYPYYSAYTNKWYKTRQDAVKDSGGIDDEHIYYDYKPSSSTVDYTDYRTYPTTIYRFYSTANPGRYYASTTEAYNAAGGYGTIKDYYENSSVSYSTYYSSTYPWYSSYTKRYYKTYAEALAVSPNSSYVYSGSSTSYVNPYYYSDLYYGLGLSSTSSSSSKNTSSTVTVGNSKGWSAVTKAVNNAKSGAEITVNMSKETTIPADVMAALKGKNVTVDFKLANGATYAINGTTVSTSGSVNVATTYGVKNIPSSIISKAVKANNGVSSAQFSVSNGSLGANAAVTVKVSDKRAGCSAKLYRYDSSSNSLTLVSKSAVQSTGKVEFTGVKQGGNYVIVLS